MASNSRSVDGGGDSRSRHRSIETEADWPGHRDKENSKRGGGGDTRRRHKSYGSETDSEAEQQGRRDKENNERSGGDDRRRRHRSYDSESDIDAERWGGIDREKSRYYCDRRQDQLESRSKRREAVQRERHHHDPHGRNGKNEESQSKRRRHSEEEDESKSTDEGSRKVSKRRREDDRHCKEGLNESDKLPGKDKEREQQLYEKKVTTHCSSKQKPASKWDEPPVQENRESCLIIHNVFEAGAQRDQEFCYKLRDYFLERSVRDGPVHHVNIDSKAGCIYMLFDSAASANKASMRWNNRQYDGNTLTTSLCDGVKYANKHGVYRRISVKTLKTCH
ncbi:hypothetical protein ACUV84_025347 [Puccinellia chinampoensis]